MADDEQPFRLKWRALEGWGEGYFDGYMGSWRVAQITPARGLVARQAPGCHWSLPIVCHWQSLLPGPYSGEAESNRLAARAAETALPNVLQTHEQFAMRIEMEIEFRAEFGLPTTRFIEHHRAIKRGENPVPLFPHGEGDWQRYLDGERRAGRRNWVSPEDMRAWFGEAWVDPREAGKTAPDPGPTPPRRRARR